MVDTIKCIGSDHTPNQKMALPWILNSATFCTWIPNVPDCLIGHIYSWLKNSSLSPPVSSQQRPETRSFDVSLIWAQTHGWANNRNASDLRRARARYDITVMMLPRPHSVDFALEIPIRCKTFPAIGLLIFNIWFPIIWYGNKWVFNSLINQHVITITCISYDNLGPVSISEKTSFRKISSSLEATRLVLWIVVSLWNLTGTSATQLPKCLSNFRAIGQF